MKVVIYTRVSSEEQKLEGVSLAAQRAKLLAYCEAYGHEVVAVIEDGGVSAKNLERDGIKRALSLLDEGKAEGLLISKIDRLTRSVRDLMDLLDAYFGNKKHALISMAEQFDTATAQGRMILTFMAALGQMEREQAGERTSAALRYKQSIGEHVGAVPYGADVIAGKLAGAEAELAVIDRIISEREEGNTWQSIADRLQAEGVPSKRGGKWAAATTRNLYLRHKAVS